MPLSPDAFDRLRDLVSHDANDASPARTPQRVHRRKTWLIFAAVLAMFALAGVPLALSHRHTDPEKPTVLPPEVPPAEHASAVYTRIASAAEDYGRRLRALAVVMVRFEAARAVGHARHVVQRETQTPERLQRIERDVSAVQASAAAGLPAGAIDSVLGLQAWLKGDLPQAEQSLKNATDHSPELEEAWEGLAMVALEQRDYEESEGLWTEALSRHAGQPRLLEGRAFARIAWGVELAEAGQDPFPKYDAAVADCESAIAGGTPEPASWFNLALAHFLAGLEHFERAQDATKDMQQALDALDMASRFPTVEVANVAAWTGLCHAAQARIEASRGGSGEDLYDKAEKEFKAALDKDASHAASLQWQAAARVQRLLRHLLAGQDAGADPDKVIESLGHAIDQDGESTDLRESRGCAWLAQALLDVRKGVPSAGDWKKAIDDLNEAVRLAPESAACLAARAQAEMLYGAMQADLDKPDAEPLLASAVKDGDEATGKNAARLDPWITVSRASTLLGTAHLKHGEEGEESFHRALEAASHARQIHKDDARVQVALGGAWQGLGVCHFMKKTLCKEEFQRALDSYKAAVETMPSLEPQLAPRIAECKSHLR